MLFFRNNRYSAKTRNTKFALCTDYAEIFNFKEMARVETIEN